MNPSDTKTSRAGDWSHKKFRDSHWDQEKEVLRFLGHVSSVQKIAEDAKTRWRKQDVDTGQMTRLQYLQLRFASQPFSTHPYLQ